MCWHHGMEGIGGLGMDDVHGGCSGAGGDDWVIVTVGWVLGDGGAAGGGTRNEKVGGL